MIGICCKAVTYATYTYMEVSMLIRLALIRYRMLWILYLLSSHGHPVKSKRLTI
jgi:hypothetical protein